MGKGGSSILVAGIVVVAACSGASRASSPPNTAPSTLTTTASTTTAITTNTAAATTTVTKPEPAFSFDDAVAPPRLLDTGTDYIAILQSLEGFGTWLGAHRPDPTLAPTAVASGTRLLTNWRNNLTYLRDNRLRIVERLNGPDTVTILSANPDAFSARVVQRISVHQIFDRSGHLEREQRFAGTTTYLEVVVRAHGRWYLAASDEQEPAVVHL